MSDVITAPRVPTAAAPEPVPIAAPPSRLLSLDAFRGLTIAGMLLVNNPGSWAHVHPPLRHAPTGEPIALKSYLYQNLFASWLAPLDASLAFALVYVLFWLGIMAILYRQRIFIKV